jgi:hypothetical protein
MARHDWRCDDVHRASIGHHDAAPLAALLVLSAPWHESGAAGIAVVLLFHVDCSLRL